MTPLKNHRPANKPMRSILKKMDDSIAEFRNRLTSFNLPSLLSIAIAIYVGFMIAEISRVPVPQIIKVKPGYALIALPNAQLDASLTSNQSLGKAVKLAILTAPNLDEKCLFKTNELVLVSPNPNPTILIKQAQFELIRDLLRQIKKQKLGIQLLSLESPLSLPPCLS